jgi:hypothetical protein
MRKHSILIFDQVKVLRIVYKIPNFHSFGPMHKSATSVFGRDVLQKCPTSKFYDSTFGFAPKDVLRVHTLLKNNALVSHSVYVL